MKILYLGDSGPGSTSLHRARALERIGHEVTIVDPYLWNKNLGSRFPAAFHFRTGYRFLQPRMKRWTNALWANIARPDVIWVNGGELFGRDCVQSLRRSGAFTILYNNDDPTGGNDRHRFDTLKTAISAYDACVVMRDLNVPEYYALGAKKVIKAQMSFDEVAHAPFPGDYEVPSQFQSEIAFIGTWMRDERRDHFLVALIRRGLPVSIWGHRWDRSPLYAELRPFIRGGNLVGDGYRNAISGAKICLGLLSRKNRDLITARSFEIPYLGGLLCAERTSEHSRVFVEDVDAVLWSTAEECGDKCAKLLQDHDRRERIRGSGFRRVRSGPYGNEAKVRYILSEIADARREGALI